MRLRKGLALSAAAGAALVALAALLVSAQASAPAAPKALGPNDVTAVLIAGGLTQPVDIARTGLVTDTRLFVVERDGVIKIVQGNTVLPTPFLDIDSIVDAETHGEMGLLGLAFSPNYASDGRFYVYYNRTADLIHVARYTVSSNPNVANPASTVVMTITHNTANNHNGGDLAFGPDGYLYLAPGDGGNTPELAQDTSVLLGKVLRINVTGVPTYTIPASNPYTTTAPRDEIWALGLRNPFRFSFDRQTGDMYIGDVGQGAWEEIDYQPAGMGGLNYGWRCYEGNHVGNLSGCGPIGSYTFPVAEYCNEGQGPSCTNGGRAVIGGYVYRGQAYPNMAGNYFFADNSSSRFWAMQAGPPWTVTQLNIGNVPNPSGFGEGVAGQIYVVSLGNGSLYCLQGGSAQARVAATGTQTFLPVIFGPAGGC
jgi:glucose/arabinose dehydrogenase